MGVVERARSEALNGILRVLQEFREFASGNEDRRNAKDIPTQWMEAFIQIASNEGITIKDLTERMDMAQSSVSRHVQALSKWKLPKIEGLDLVVAKEHPEDRRLKVVFLTVKGQTLAERLLNRML